MAPITFFVSGYKRTGKDTFASELASGLKLAESEETPNLRWNVLSKDGHSHNLEVFVHAPLTLKKLSMASFKPKLYQGLGLDETKPKDWLKKSTSQALQLLDFPILALIWISLVLVFIESALTVGALCWAAGYGLATFPPRAHTGFSSLLSQWAFAIARLGSYICYPVHKKTDAEMVEDFKDLLWFERSAEWSAAFSKMFYPPRPSVLYPNDDCIFAKLRTFMIEVGQTGRIIHPDYWSVKVADQIDSSSEENYIICDWRFPNEIQSIKSMGIEGTVVSIRLFRKSVPVPTDEAERELDKFEADLVLIPPGPEEREALIQRLPIYSNYYSCGYLAFS